MARIKSVLEKVESIKINPHYDMTVENMYEIYRNGKNIFNVIMLSFNFGYFQGMKAAKSELNHNGVK